MAGITQEATSPSVGNAEELDKLLSGEEPAATEEATTEENAEDSVATDEQGEETQSEETATEEGGEEASTEEGESEQAEEEAEQEETELSIDESERDYSQAAYEKAAAHYAKTLGLKVEDVDLNNPLIRGLLKENMDRGRAIAAMKREEAEAETKGKTETEEGTEKPGATQTQPSKPTPEQIKKFTQDAAIVAKAHLVPEVAMHVATRFTKALWPNEDLPELTQEQANDFTLALSEMFWMQLEDALPAILGQSRQSLSADPVFGAVEAQTINARALEQMDSLKDKTSGKPLYPDLEQLVESGAIKKVLQANPQVLKLTAGDGRNPVANQLLRYQTAYKIARGESVNLQTVSTAVQTGKKQAEDRAKKIASGRVSSGKPTGGFNKGQSDVQKLVSELTGGSGSKFSAAVAASRRSR